MLPLPYLVRNPSFEAECLESISHLSDTLSSPSTITGQSSHRLEWAMKNTPSVAIPPRGTSFKKKANTPQLALRIDSSCHPSLTLYDIKTKVINCDYNAAAQDWVFTIQLKVQPLAASALDSALSTSSPFSFSMTESTSDTLCEPACTTPERTIFRGLQDFWILHDKLVQAYPAAVGSQTTQRQIPMIPVVQDLAASDPTQDYIKQVSRLKTCIQTYLNRIVNLFGVCSLLLDFCESRPGSLDYQDRGQPGLDLVEDLLTPLSPTADAAQDTVEIRVQLGTRVRAWRHSLRSLTLASVMRNVQKAFPDNADPIWMVHFFDEWEVQCNLQGDAELEMMALSRGVVELIV
ncbi:hypothetical protein HDV03_002277 [Kappamyces sp. JEL0829]|nr:hypothetical protein HDV03_002277 [Kappamyces sp. JEL0829]